MLRHFAVVAAVALVAGLASWLPSRAFEAETIEVSALGFNPPVCKMNRGFVRFKNVGPSTIKVGRPGLQAGDPPSEVREMAPGEYSIAFSIPNGGSTVFLDVDRPDHRVTVVTPVFVEHWDPVCTPDPNYTPPQPPCRSNPYCLRLPVLSSE
jgi:hypothetical protein